MNQDQTVSTGQETQIPELDADPVVESVSGEVDASQVPEDPPAKPADETARALERTQKRIDKLTAKNHRTSAENDQLRAELARFEQANDNTQPRTLSQADVDAQADFKVHVLNINRQTNDAVKAGTKANPDFLSVVQEGLMKEVPLFQSNGLPTPFMKVVLEADSPEVLLYHLGKNPDLAEELAELSETKLAKRLDRLERELEDKSKPKPGTAPTPLQPVRTSTSSASPADNDSDEVWMKKEAARMKSKGMNAYG